MLVLDTSALVKLYLQEEGREQVLQAVQQFEVVALATLALPEAAAIFARMAQAGAFTVSEAQKAHSALLKDWPGFYRVRLTSDLALEASALARSHLLRGADAVHLATATWLAREHKGIRFLAFDEELNRAARVVVKVWGE